MCGGECWECGWGIGCCDGWKWRGWISSFSSLIGTNVFSASCDFSLLSSDDFSRMTDCWIILGLLSLSTVVVNTVELSEDTALFTVLLITGDDVSEDSFEGWWSLLLSLSSDSSSASWVKKCKKFYLSSSNEINIHNQEDKNDKILTLASSDSVRSNLDFFVSFVVSLTSVSAAAFRFDFVVYK